MVCHCRQRIITVRYPAVFDRDVLTLDIAHLGKTAAECGIELHGNGLAQAAEISNYRHRWLLLRARRERPQCCPSLHRETSPPSSLQLPGKPRAKRAPHDQLFVLRGQPG